MEYEVYYDTERADEADPARRRVHRVLRRLEESGVPYRVVDAAELSDAEREHAYLRAVRPSVHKKYRVRNVFGTRKYAGRHFGRETPALLVIEGGQPVDVYPHESQDGKIVSIEDYLNERFGPDTPDLGRRRAAAARLSALRAEIGPIGVTAAELVREARAETAYGDDEPEGA